MHFWAPASRPSARQHAKSPPTCKPSATPFPPEPSLSPASSNLQPRREAGTQGNGHRLPAGDRHPRISGSRWGSWESLPAVTTVACATAVPRSLLRVRRILPQLVEKLVDGRLRLRHGRARCLPPGVDRLDTVARTCVGNGQPGIQRVARQPNRNRSATCSRALTPGRASAGQRRSQSMSLGDLGLWL